MISFRDLELTDKDFVQSMICASDCYGSDYGFTNNYIWRHSFNPKVYFTDTRMYMWMPDYGVYAYPKGSGDIEESIELLLGDAHERGLKLKMRGLSDKALEEFMPVYGDRFTIIEDRKSADYIYSKDKLCNLPGRHLSSKRNHINRFLKNGEWRFERVTADNLDPAREYVNAFYQVKDDPSLEDEAVAISEMFDNYEALDFIGGMLYQNNRAVAFTAGTPLGDIVFDWNFEKATPGVEGAYTMVNKQMANLVAELLPSVQFFNREEDMGIEGLRKAKESYHPDILLMKYYAVEK